MKYALKKPIQRGTETITELNFREEVVAGDMRGIVMKEQLAIDDILLLAGRLCAQPVDVMNKLSIPDYIQVAPLVMGFFATGLSE